MRKVFNWDFPENLIPYFENGFTHLFLSGSKRRLESVVLWGGLKKGIRIHSYMQDVAERFEVGVLRFSLVDEVNLANEKFELPFHDGRQIKIQKLVLDQDEVRAESGIALLYPGHNELIIVPSGLPCTLAVSGIDIGMPFTPEYDLSDYTRISIHPTKQSI